MGFEVAQYRNGDTGRYQWAVYSKSSGCWYFANSDLFPALLARALKKAGIGTHIKLDAIPDCVTVTPGKLLSIVTIEVQA